MSQASSSKPKADEKKSQTNQNSVMQADISEGIDLFNKSAEHVVLHDSIDVRGEEAKQKQELRSGELLNRNAAQQGGGSPGGGARGGGSCWEEAVFAADTSRPRNFSLDFQKIRKARDSSM